jgi:putative spermidine/putrescine transport system ATP-binding protein
MNAPGRPANAGRGLGVHSAPLELRGLTKAFGGTRAVHDLSLRIEAGTFLTLLGPSGSGKTTTLRMIAGFEEPTAGEIVVAGGVITDKPAHKRNIGMVFQQYALFPHLTVFQNVAYPLEMRRVSTTKIHARVEAALGLVRLGGFESRYPRQLSGGQQQRVALARAIVFEPPVLLMDEPLGALDKRLREAMQVEIRHLQKELAITTVSVTHDQVEALVMSDVIAVLDRGVLQQFGPPLELYRRPANQFVADFIGESNLLSGALAEGSGERVFRTANGLLIRVAETGGGHPAAGRSIVVRPEAIRLGAAAEGAPNHYDAEVREALYVGDLVKYRLLVDSGDELVAKTLAPASSPYWSVGEKITIGWDHQDCLIVNP